VKPGRPGPGWLSGGENLCFTFWRFQAVIPARIFAQKIRFGRHSG
jgi:hypothetical protein